MTTCVHDVFTATLYYSLYLLIPFFSSPHSLLQDVFHAVVFSIRDSYLSGETEWRFVHANCLHVHKEWYVL